MGSRMRVTRSKRDMRRSHHRVSEPTVTVNEDGVRHMRHRASTQTGKYRGRQVIDVEARIAKKQAKQQERRSQQQEEAE